MILLAGAFELAPLIAVLVVSALLALPAATVWGVALSVLGNPAFAGLVLAASAAGLGVLAEGALRRRAAGYEPKWACSLGALGLSRRVRPETVGARALGLGRLHALGAPVPDGLVLTSSLVESIRSASKLGQAPDRVWSALPAGARREIERFLSRSKGKIVVRASFVGEGPRHSYAGVFPSIRDVDPNDRGRLVQAVLSLVESADDDVAREYRRRTGAEGSVARAVVLQRQLEPEVVGAVASRGPYGAADSVTVDAARKRSPVRSYRYDLVDGKAVELGAGEPFETPAWMHRLSILAVALEEELGDPIHLEYAVEDGQPYLLDLRRVPGEARKTWVHAAPLDASQERLPRFAQELRGGLPLVRRVLGETLARAGADADVKEEEVRYVDGLVYLDAEVIRRALSRLGADVLLRGGAKVTLRAVAPIRRRAIPSVPAVTEVTRAAWQGLRAWHARYLLGAAQVQLELVARQWLIGTLLRLTDGTIASAEDRRGHPALRFVLGRRLEEAAEEASRQRKLLEQSEAELGLAVARLLARGAEAWNAMFKGDRHLHATLDEIDRWHEDIGAREGLEAEWRTRRAAFDERRGEATVPRVHRPPIPDDRGTSSLGPHLRGVGVVPGAAAGIATMVAGQDRGPATGGIVLLADARPDLALHVYDARGIVLLTGGLVSKVALLALELSVPTVLCPNARSSAKREITIDGAKGTVTTR